MSYRNKTYVCLDYDEDSYYYNMMKAWKENDNIEFDFYNAHELNRLMEWSSEETIKNKLRERMNNTVNFIVLVGENTKYKYRFVRWEIEEAIKRDLPIIVVNLNNKIKLDKDKCPPILQNELAIHISKGQKIIKYSLDNWPEYHKKHREIGNSGEYFWPNKVYENLGYTIN